MQVSPTDGHARPAPDLQQRGLCSSLMYKIINKMYSQNDISVGHGFTEKVREIGNRKTTELDKRKQPNSIKLTLARLLEADCGSLFYSHLLCGIGDFKRFNFY